MLFWFEVFPIVFSFSYWKAMYKGCGYTKTKSATLECFLGVCVCFFWEPRKNQVEHKQKDKNSSPIDELINLTRIFPFLSRKRVPQKVFWELCFSHGQQHSSILIINSIKNEGGYGCVSYREKFLPTVTQTVGRHVVKTFHNSDSDAKQKQTGAWKLLVNWCGIFLLPWKWN